MPTSFEGRFWIASNTDWKGAVLTQEELHRRNLQTLDRIARDQAIWTFGGVGAEIDLGEIGSHAEGGYHCAFSRSERAPLLP